MPMQAPAVPPGPHAPPRSACSAATPTSPVWKAAARRRRLRHAGRHARRRQDQPGARRGGALARPQRLGRPGRRWRRAGRWPARWRARWTCSCGDGDAAPQLLRLLPPDEPLLLVLDNAEHLIERCAELATQLCGCAGAAPARDEPAAAGGGRRTGAAPGTIAVAGRGRPLPAEGALALLVDRIAAADSRFEVTPRRRCRCWRLLPAARWPAAGAGDGGRARAAAGPARRARRAGRALRAALARPPRLAGAPPHAARRARLELRPAGAHRSSDCSARWACSPAASRSTWRWR